MVAAGTQRGPAGRAARALPWPVHAGAAARLGVHRADEPAALAALARRSEPPFPPAARRGAGAGAQAPARRAAAGLGRVQPAVRRDAAGAAADGDGLAADAGPGRRRGRRPGRPARQRGWRAAARHAGAGAAAASAGAALAALQRIRRRDRLGLRVPSAPRAHAFRAGAQAGRARQRGAVRDHPAGRERRERAPGAPGARARPGAGAAARDGQPVQPRAAAGRSPAGDAGLHRHHDDRRAALAAGGPVPGKPGAGCAVAAGASGLRRAA